MEDPAGYRHRLERSLLTLIDGVLAADPEKLNLFRTGGAFVVFDNLGFHWMVRQEPIPLPPNPSLS